MNAKQIKFHITFIINSAGASGAHLGNQETLLGCAGDAYDDGDQSLNLFGSL